jgi:drug/metabolite transporter (DMT)-like permease
MRKAYLQLHLSILLWGFTGIFGRAIDLKEVLLVWYRLLITVGILLLITLYTKKVKKLPPRELLRISFVGLLVTMHWIFFYGAIKYSNVSIGVSCMSTVAVFTSILEPIMTGRKISLPELVLAVLAAAGMFLIFEVQEFHRTGIILGIMAAFIGSVFTILNSKLSKRYNSETITTYELGSGLFYLTLFIPAYIHFAQPAMLFPDTKNWEMLLVFSLFCTVIPFNLSIKAFKHVSAYASSLSINLEPLYGIILAFIFFHEQKDLKPGFYAGTAIIVLSVILYMVLKHRHQLREFAKGQRGRFMAK